MPDLALAEADPVCGLGLVTEDGKRGDAGLAVDDRAPVAAIPMRPPEAAVGGGENRLDAVLDDGGAKPGALGLCQGVIQPVVGQPHRADGGRGDEHLGVRVVPPVLPGKRFEAGGSGGGVGGVPGQGVGEAERVDG